MSHIICIQAKNQWSYIVIEKTILYSGDTIYPSALYHLYVFLNQYISYIRVINDKNLLTMVITSYRQ